MLTERIAKLESPKAKPQDQQPGVRAKMYPAPLTDDPDYRAGNKLDGKKALITGGDSGIGRAVAIAFAKEGADVAIIYKEEDADAEETRQLVNKYGQECHLIRGDIGSRQFCDDAVAEAVEKLGRLNILVNNAGEQHEQESLQDITEAQLERTYRTNIFAVFHITKAALKHLSAGDSIINTTSITAYKGHETLMDYSTTKGAILAFTRSLSGNLVDDGIRVNAVAPGPIWTPLIPASFSKDHLKKFGEDTPMKRPGQPCELAPAYVYLACHDSSYMTGQVLHINGGTLVGS